MKVAYIAHPISGDVKGNIEKIRAICRDINLNQTDVIPFVPYCMDLLCLDDNFPSERERGFKNNRYHLESGYIDELWLFGDRISDGMHIEINTCLIEMIKIVPKTPETKKAFDESLQF